MKKMFLVFVFVLTAVWPAQIAAANSPDPCYLGTPFTDVPEYHPYEAAITELYCRGIINGYSDETFRPGNSVNRAEFLKMMYEAGGDSIDSNIDLPFPDVPENEWYAKYVKVAYENGIIDGYPDGTFKPENTINFAEASKMIANYFFGDQLFQEGDIYNPCYYELFTEEGEWFNDYLFTLDNKCILPGYVLMGDYGFDASIEVSRGDMAEMIYRTSFINILSPRYTWGDTAENFFNVEDVEVGDRVANMEIVSMEPVSEDYGTVSKDNAEIQFSGWTYLTGYYEYYTTADGEFTNTVCFSVNDTYSLRKMPRVIGAEAMPYFCFSNSVFAGGELGPIGSSGMATIAIENYLLKIFPAEVTSLAELVYVAEKY